MRKPAYRCVFPLACLALVTACTKGTDISAEAPRPALAAPRTSISTSPSAPVAEEPSREQRAPELDDPPADFHLAAIIHSNGRSGLVGRLVDYGDRLVVFDDLPVAQAKADGPIVASRALARGLPKDETHSLVVHGAAGGSKGSWLVYGQVATRGSAPDGVAYRFDGAAWQKTSRYRFSHDHGMPWLAGVFAWKDGGATVIEQDMVAAKDDSESMTVAKVYWFDAAKRTVSKPVAINLSLATAAPDGHVWLLGSREEKEGLWAAHVEPDGKTTWETLPGTEACGSNVATRGVLSRDGGIVAADVEVSSGQCGDLAGVHGFLRDTTGWHPTGARPAGSDLLAFDGQGRTWSAERGSLVARASDGKIVSRERMPTVVRSDPDREDSALVQRVDAQVYDAEGATNGDGCYDARLVVRKNGDRWLVRQCNVGSEIVAAVFRDRVTQPVVVIAAEEAR
jgi:hypothetical protein